jgi:hypothetical protein
MDVSPRTFPQSASGITSLPPFGSGQNETKILFLSQYGTYILFVDAGDGQASRRRSG